MLVQVPVLRVFCRDFPHSFTFQSAVPSRSICLLFVSVTIKISVLRTLKRERSNILVLPGNLSADPVGMADKAAPAELLPG